MIVSKIFSGLGNQLFQYATARAVSLKNNTALWIDVSNFENDAFRNFGLDRFNLNCKIVNNFELPFFLKIGKKIGLINFNYYEDKIWEFDVKLNTDKSKFIHLSGYWGWPKYFEDYAFTIRKELQLKISLEHNCTYWIKLAENTNSVSLHVRRGDYLSDNHAANLLGTLDIIYYQKAIEYFEQNLTKPYFFLFSDDIAWLKEKFIPETGIIQFVIVENKGIEHDAQELALMSYCKHNIIANSTFSWWGAWLNTNPDKIVIQPQIWYRNKEAQKVYEKNYFDIAGCTKL